MGLIAIFLIALAMAADAFSVAVVVGATLPAINKRHYFRLSWHFGLFQGGFPIIGWLAGRSILPYIGGFDHWLTFGLLAFIGIRMMIEAIKAEKDNAEHLKDPTKGLSLVMLSVATAIDALAIGFSISLAGHSIWLPAFVIGVVTLLLTALGLRLGNILKHAGRLGEISGFLGGLILLAIGFRMLYEHDAFGQLARLFGL